MTAGLEVTQTPEVALALRCLRSFEPDCVDTAGGDDFFWDAEGVEAVAGHCAGIVLPKAGETRAARLLAAGAATLLVGEAALRDSELISRLAADYPERVGIYAAVRRQRVTWTLDTESNADFRTLVPSIAAPGWEILLANGAESGVLLRWWLHAMRERGASHFLVQAEIRDDADLNLLAELVEEFGDRFWVAPLSANHLPYAEWVEYGRCRQLVLPPDDYQRQAEHFAAFLPANREES